MEYKNMELYEMIKEDLGKLNANSDSTTEILQTILRILEKAIDK